MSDGFCLHCAVIAIISEHRPQGLDHDDASEVLRCLGMVAAGILQHADDKEAAMQGFMDFVKIVRDDPRNSTFSAGDAVRH